MDGLPNRPICEYMPALKIDLSKLNERQQRLAVFLLQRAEISMVDGEQEVRIEVSRDAVANHLGVKPESVYHPIRRLSRQLGLRIPRWSKRGRPSNQLATRAA